MKKSLIIYLVILVALIYFGFYSISKTVIFSNIFSNYSLTLNFLERTSGVLIFTLIFMQIVLGAYMDKFSTKLGNWMYKVHAIQGPIIYILALIHPLFFLIFNFKLFHIIDPFYIYTQICFLCKDKFELFYTFGRLALWFLTIGVFAVVFKNSDRWMKTNWRKLHVVNYVAFFFIAIHGYFLGNDFKTQPLNHLFLTALIIVIITIILKLKKIRSIKRVIF